jgi:hypothetical protein
MNCPDYELLMYCPNGLRWIMNRVPHNVAMKLYSQSYFIDEKNLNKKFCLTHYILPHFYKDRSLIIFSISKYRKNYFIFNDRSSFISLGFKIWKDKMIELNIFGWEY